MYTNGLKDRFGSPLLSKRDADELYLDKQNGSKSYDWTPNTDIKIQFSLTNDYTIPVNGWLMINSNTSDGNEMWSLSVNDKQLFNSDQRGNLPIQILLSKNDILSTDSTANRSCYFLPCKSEGYDYRITKTPYDVWAKAVVEDENGNLSVQNFYIPDASSWYNETPLEVRNSIIRVDGEVAYDVNNNLICNIQSSEIVNGTLMFCEIPLESFTSDLSSLVNGADMFWHTSLTSFDSDLSSLVYGGSMFCEIPITSFSSDLSSLTNGYHMFRQCYNLTSFDSDLSSLVNGASMFEGCESLTSFDSDLSSLLSGVGMFNVTFLNEESIQTIADTIQDISGLDKTDDSIWQYPSSMSFNEDGSYTWTYSNIDQSLRGRLDLSYDRTSITDLTNIYASIAQIKEKGWDVYLDDEYM